MHVNCPLYGVQFNIDINGDAAPNKMGYDLFQFYITKEGVKPYDDGDADCNITGRGVSCAVDIIYKDSTSYMSGDLAAMCQSRCGGDSSYSGDPGVICSLACRE